MGVGPLCPPLAESELRCVCVFVFVGVFYHPRPPLAESEWGVSALSSACGVGTAVCLCVCVCVFVGVFYHPPSSACGVGMGVCAPRPPLAESEWVRVCACVYMSVCMSARVRFDGCSCARRGLSRQPPDASTEALTYNLCDSYAPSVCSDAGDSADVADALRATAADVRARANDFGSGGRGPANMFYICACRTRRLPSVPLRVFVFCVGILYRRPLSME